MSDLNHMFVDDQGGGNINVVKGNVSPCLLLNAAKGHGLVVVSPKKETGVVAFAQNTREEVRVIGDDGQVCGALSASSGTHQTTYIAVAKKRNKNVPCGTL